MRTFLLASLVLLSGCLCKSREEKLNAAEDEGNMLVATKARLLKGVGEAVKKEGKEAAETVAEGTGEVVKGLGQGIDKGLKDVKVLSDESLAPLGIAVTRAARSEDGTTAHTITAYVTFDKPFTGTLELRAFDDKTLEVGRAKVDAAEKESGAHYVDFLFDARTPLLNAVVQLKATAKAP